MKTKTQLNFIWEPDTLRMSFYSNAIDLQEILQKTNTILAVNIIYTGFSFREQLQVHKLMTEMISKTKNNIDNNALLREEFPNYWAILADKDYTGFKSEIG